MKRILDSLEVVGNVEVPLGACEVCALAEAGYDEAAHHLIVTLTSFLRTTDLRTKEQRFSDETLPPLETVVETVEEDEAFEVARDIFHRWVRKVRESAETKRAAAG